MTVTLTPYGGADEIGGNAFLLDDGDTKLFLDVGKRFGNDKMVEQGGLRPGWSDYWDDYLKPRTFRLVPDLLALDLVPDVPGLYRADLGGQTSPRPAVDAIVISHAHQDHFGLLGLIRPDIPVLTSLESRATLHSVEETGLSGAEFDLLTTRSRGNLGRNKNGSLSNAPQFPPGPSRIFQDSSHADVGAWKLDHYAVDHSIHGARATIVTGRQVSIAYTGDYRLHGRSAHTSKMFVEKAGGVDFLLTEGTRVNRPQDRKKGESDKESDVEGDIQERIAQEEARRGRTGFVGIAYPPRDLDRFISIYNVAKRTGRRLAIMSKQAHLIEALRAAGRDDLPDPRNDPSLAIYIRARRTGTLLSGPAGPLSVANANLTVDEVAVGPEDFQRYLERDYDEWERPYLRCPNTITHRDVAKEPNAFLFSISYWTISELLDIAPESAAWNGLYIHSQTQPFNDEMETDKRKLARWLGRWHLDWAQTHVSGHVGEEELDWVIDQIRPRTLVPVHTLSAQYTADRYQQRTGNKVILPRHAQVARLS